MLRFSLYLVNNWDVKISSLKNASSEANLFAILPIPIPPKRATEKFVRR